MKKSEDELSRLVRRLNSLVGRPSPAKETDPRPGAGEPAAPGAPGERSPYAPDDDPVETAGPEEPAGERAGAFVTDTLRPVAERLDAYLAQALRLKASDILLVAGYRPSARVHGLLQPIGDDELTPADTRSLSLLLLDDVRYKEFQREKAVDFAFDRAGGRFRCDLHFQRGAVALALRSLPRRIPSLEELNLPPVLERFTKGARGLVLFVGPTGCGKSTSLAALVEIINRSRSCHIVTVEDPVEFRHQNGRAIVEQIEIGRDALSFARALRHCLRQDPDVIMVGEMRDLETITTALTAAETGHLVFSTLHTGDAAQTVDRIIDVFPEHQQSQIRQQLAMCLTGIVAQHLVPTSDGRGRLPACEVLLANDAIRNLIRTGKNHQIPSHIAMARREGMITLDDALAELTRQGRVTLEEATLRASHAEEFKKLI